jgi:hypothetical protein
MHDAEFHATIFDWFQKMHDRMEEMARAAVEGHYDYGNYRAAEWRRQIYIWGLGIAIRGWQQTVLLPGDILDTNAPHSDTLCVFFHYDPWGIGGSQSSTPECNYMEFPVSWIFDRTPADVTEYFEKRRMAQITAREAALRRIRKEQAFVCPKCGEKSERLDH